MVGVLASATGQARFLREIEIASTLNHPKAATVYGAEVVDGAMTPATEWIDGQPIRWRRSLMVDGGPTPPAGGRGSAAPPDRRIFMRTAA